MQYDKLVRDGVPEYIREQGGDPEFHVAGEQEYWEKLKQKLNEEVAEFQADESLGELVDILEVLDAIIEYKSFDPVELLVKKDEKSQKRGAFCRRLILDKA